MFGAFPIVTQLKKTKIKNIIRYQPPFTGYACPLKKDLDCKTDNTPTAHPDPKDCRRFIKCSQVSIIITTFSTTKVDTYSNLKLVQKKPSVESCGDALRFDPVS